MITLEKFTIENTINEDSYLTLIDILSRKFGGVQSASTEFDWGKMKKTIGFSKQYINFNNGCSVLFLEKHKIRMNYKTGTVQAGESISFQFVEKLGFTY